YRYWTGRSVRPLRLKVRSAPRSEARPSRVDNLAEDRVTHRPVPQAMERRHHRDLGRIKGDGTALAGWQFCQAAFKALDKVVAKPEFDCTRARERPVRPMAGDKDRLDMSTSGSADAGHREPLLAAKLVLHPGCAPAPGDVGRAKALGHDALQAE